MHAQYKQKAITLRKEGKTYDEILKTIPVARSTLSLWLRSVELAQKQVQKITKRRIAARQKGVEAIVAKRKAKVLKIQKEAHLEARKLVEDPFWMLGPALYWGEGDKPKPWSTRQDLRFSNMDPHAIRIFVKWARRFLKLTQDDFIYEIYLHEFIDSRREECITYWSERLSVSRESFALRHKKGSIRTNRRNTGDTYFGLVRVRIRRSTDLSRRVFGWLQVVIQSL